MSSSMLKYFVKGTNILALVSQQSIWDNYEYWFKICRGKLQ